MIDLQQSESNINQTGSNRNKKQQIDEQKCQNCYYHKKKPKLFFSACQHNEICLKCAEKHMLNCINERRNPTCIMGSDCKAQMITGQKSLFQYFSQSSLEKWRLFLQTRERASNLPPCKVTNCGGVIQRLRCLKCSQYYCENCLQFTHSFRVKCIRKVQIQIDGIKECPRCKQKYERMSGCQHITCFTCHYEFCEGCKGQWSPLHHGCMGSLFSQRSSNLRMEKKTQNCCTIF